MAENAVKVLYVFVLGQSRLLKDVDYVAPLFHHMPPFKSWPLRHDNFGHVSGIKTCIKLHDQMAAIW